MRTPAGKDCHHYHEDFHRGRDIQECRLAKENPQSMRWRPGDCAHCPVPDILNANANPQLRLELTIKPRFASIGRQLEVRAWCRGNEIPLEDAYTGCLDQDKTKGLEIFRQALEQSEDD